MSPNPLDPVTPAEVRAFKAIDARSAVSTEELSGALLDYVKALIAEGSRPAIVAALGALLLERDQAKRGA
jgi:hypothetical protein